MKNRPNLDLTALKPHINALRKHPVAMSPRSPQFSHRAFHDAFFAPGLDAHET